MNDPICQVNEEFWCERHQCRHVGRVLELSRMDNELGARFRLSMDGINVTELVRGMPVVVIGNQPPVARCAHLGTEKVGLRKCPTCTGNVRRKEYACALGLGVDGRAVPSEDCGPGRCPGYAPAADATSSA
jgi:hypothetical protein